MKKRYLIVVILCSIITNLKAQWNLIYDDFSLLEGGFNCLEITSDSSIFLGTATNIYKSKTLGFSWEFTFDQAGAVSIDCYTTDTCYCAGNYEDIETGGAVLRTYNAGESWEVPPSSPFYWPNNVDVFALDGKQVFVSGCTEFGYVQITDNGFDSNNVVIPSIDAECFGAVSCVNRDTCLCVTGSLLDNFGEDFRVYKTIDGGLNWNENIAANFGRDIVHITDDLVYLLERYVLIKSIDGGEAWDTIKYYSEIPGSHFVAMKFVDENVGYLAEQFDVQDSISIYRTNNGGLDWYSTVINDIPIGIFDIDCINKDHCFFIGGLGEIYSTVNGGIQTNTSSHLPKLEIDISPNPASNLIKLQLPQNIQIESVYTYNIFGQITDITFDETGAAKIEDLMPGIYFTQITTKTATIVITWIKE